MTIQMALAFLFFLSSFGVEQPIIDQIRVILIPNEANTTPMMIISPTVSPSTVSTVPAVSPTISTMDDLAKEKTRLRSSRGIGRVQAQMYFGYEGAEIGKIGFSLTDYFSGEIVSVKANGVAISADKLECGQKIQDSTLLLCGFYATITPTASTTEFSITHEGVEKHTSIGPGNKDNSLSWF